MKRRILDILKSNASVISGASLSRQLGISRVSVWKHIKTLQAAGYDIRSNPKGYCFEGSPDIPYPWEFPDRAACMHYFHETDSTMAVARDLARSGCPDFTVVVAGKQDNGRGRLNRKWISNPGGLYFTVVLKPRIPPALVFRVNFAASFILAETLRGRYGIEAGVKWPNDILVHGKKVAGILSELEAESDRVHFVTVGIGINVNNDVTAVDMPAASLKEILGREVSRKDLLGEFLDRYETQMSDGSLDHILGAWKRCLVALNRSVTIATNRETIRGTAVDVDEYGALIVKLADGSLKQVIYGDCFIEVSGSGHGATRLKDG